MGTFSIVDESDIAPGNKCINCCVSFKIKKDGDRNILEYCASFYADGRQQEVGSYGKTFAPTSKFSCIQSICAIAAQEGLTLYQFNVKRAFLLAKCKERVYINLPGKYRLPKGKVLQCRRLIYGLKQAAHGWNQMFVKWLLDFGFVNVDNDGVTFVKNVNKNDGTQSKIFLSIHVDDGLAACSHGGEAMYKEFIATMSKDFDLSKSGELKWFLGGKVEQDRKKGIMQISQEQYCNDVLKRFQMSDCTLMLAKAMIAWSLKRQPVTVISSTENEFYSVSQCALDCVYLRRIMELLGYQQTAPTLIAQDNNACIFLIKGSGMYARAKHINTRVHRVREFAAGDKPEVKLYKIAGEYQPADIFTKGLPRVAIIALSWASELKLYMKCLLPSSVSAYHSAYYVYICAIWVVRLTCPISPYQLCYLHIFRTRTWF